MVTKPFSKQEKQSVEIFHHIHICAQEVEGFHLIQICSIHLFNMTLILGTSSIFRRSFFKTAFKEFLIDESKQFLAADIDEKAIRDPDPEILCQKIAVAKCEEILKRRDEIPE